MGICGSKVEEDEPVVEEHNDAKAEKKVEKKTQTTAAQSGSDGVHEDKESADFDFKETLKSVLLLILNRLLTALEYECEAFLDLAQKRSKKNYMDLMAPQHFEKVLRDAFDLDAVRPAEPELDRSDINYEQQRLVRILEACEKAPFRSGTTRDRLVAAVQKAAKDTQKELRDSAIQSQSSDLKIHLLFFAKAFDIVSGDIANHPELLYSNIDDMCDPK